MQVVHGTNNAYNYRRCRCGECKAAHYEQYRKDRDRRAAGPIPEEIHGKYTTYRNWGCRCAPCCEALRVQARIQRAKKK